MNNPPKQRDYEQLPVAETSRSTEYYRKEAEHLRMAVEANKEAGNSSPEIVGRFYTLLKRLDFFVPKEVDVTPYPSGFYEESRFSSEQYNQMTAPRSGIFPYPEGVCKDHQKDLEEAYKDINITFGALNVEIDKLENSRELNQLFFGLRVRMIQFLPNLSSEARWNPSVSVDSPKSI